MQTCLRHGAGFLRADHRYAILEGLVMNPKTLTGRRFNPSRQTFFWESADSGHFSSPGTQGRSEYGKGSYRDLMGGQEELAWEP